MHSFTEKNYIKAIYQRSGGGEQEVSTNALADAPDTRAASVTDMLRKLSAKGTVHYVRYRGVRLTEAGERVALQVILSVPILNIDYFKARKETKTALHTSI